MFENIDDFIVNHAINVYNNLGCKSFRNDHMTYLKCDVLLFANVFEHFRMICIKYYKLNSANYISCPFLGWDDVKDDQNKI